MQLQIRNGLRSWNTDNKKITLVSDHTFLTWHQILTAALSLHWHADQTSPVFEIGKFEIGYK